MTLRNFGGRTPTLLVLVASGAMVLAQEKPSAQKPADAGASSAQIVPQQTPPPQAAPPQAVLPQDIPQAVAPEPDPTPLAGTDQDFLRKALAIVTAERELGKLASERGETEEVKALGQELLTSQAKTAAALQELAKLKNVELNLPANSPQLDEVATFRDKIGASFDSAFREYVAQDRSKSIQVFTEGTKSAKDPAVRHLAVQTLAELKKERPLAAAEAAESAKKSREISKVALNPKAAKPAPTPATKTTAAPTVNAGVTRAAPVPPPSAASSPESSDPTAVVTTTPAPTRATADPAVAVAREAVATPTPTPAPASPSTEAVVTSAPVRRLGPEPTVNPAPAISAPAPAPADVVRPANGTGETSPVIRRISEPAVIHPSPTRAARSPVGTSTIPAQATPSEEIVEAPAVTKDSQPAPRVITKAVRVVPPSYPSPETHSTEEAIKVVPKKPVTVRIQKAPRPRVIQRANEVEEEVIVQTPPPRKVIRKRVFRDSDDDPEDNEDDD